MSGKVRRWLGIGVGALALAAALAAVEARVAAAASVAVVPADTLVSVGDDFYIRVEADAFTDLKAYQLIFDYDPGIVQLLDALPGDVLTAPAGAYFGYLLPDATAPADSAWYDAARLDGSTQGPGVLVYFHFRALVVGVSPVGCLSVDYRDSNNAQTLPGCASGQIRVTGPTVALKRTWGRLKGLYR